MDIAGEAARLVTALTGVEVDESLEILKIMADAEVAHVKNFCNVTDVPSGLYEWIIQVVAGKYIRLSKKTLLGDSALSVAKSIQEGDTKVELDGKTPEELLEEMAEELTKECDLVCFRKIHW